MYLLKYLINDSSIVTSYKTSGNIWRDIELVGNGGVKERKGKKENDTDHLAHMTF